VNEATVTLGAGDDTVTGGATHLTASTGAGNDVIYAENTGAKAVATLAVGAFSGAADAATGIITEAQLLNGREVQVTVAMPEETTAGVAEAVDFVNGYELASFVLETANVLSTELELYQAVAAAINADSIINKLVEAEVDSNGNLIVTYLIDGSTVNGEQLVEINLSDEYAVAADIPEELLEAVQAANNNSAITAANVLTGYDAVTTDVYAATTGGTAASVSFNIATFADGEDLTLVLDGQTITFIDVGGAAAEVEFLGDTFAASGTTFTVSSTGANNLTITSSAAGLDLDAATLTDGLIANPIAGTITDGVLGSNGTDSTTAGVNTVNAGPGDDVIVLSSNDATIDTIEFDTGAFGNDVVVHFNTGVGGDVLDFTAWLDGIASASGSTESEVRVDTTLVTTLTNIVANSVVVADFDDVQTAFGTGAITFDGLTSAQLLSALNGSAAGGISTTFAVDTDADLVGTIGKVILLIQNDDDGDGAVDAGDNFGEYLVAEVTFTDDGVNNNVGDEFIAANIIGTLDFGEVLALNVANLA
jgi:hypothetical protein